MIKNVWVTHIHKFTDPPLSSSTDNNEASKQIDFTKNLRHHLDICRDAILSQENQNWEYTKKALGIITFSVTLFGFAFNNQTTGSSAFLEEALMLMLGGCAVLIASIGVARVIKPGDWKEVRRLDYFQKVALDYEEDVYLCTLVDTYKQAAKKNRKTLDARGSDLKIISWMAVLQIAVFVVLRFIS